MISRKKGFIDFYIAIQEFSPILINEYDSIHSSFSLFLQSMLAKKTENAKTYFLQLQALVKRNISSFEELFSIEGSYLLPWLKEMVEIEESLVQGYIQEKLHLTNTELFESFIERKKILIPLLRHQLKYANSKLTGFYAFCSSIVNPSFPEVIAENIKKSLLECVNAFLDNDPEKVEYFKKLRLLIINCIAIFEKLCEDRKCQAKDLLYFIEEITHVQFKEITIYLFIVLSKLANYVRKTDALKFPDYLSEFLKKLLADKNYKKDLFLITGSPNVPFNFQGFFDFYIVLGELSNLAIHIKEYNKIADLFLSLFNYPDKHNFLCLKKLIQENLNKFEEFFSIEGIELLAWLKEMLLVQDDIIPIYLSNLKIGKEGIYISYTQRKEEIFHLLPSNVQIKFANLNIAIFYDCCLLINDKNDFSEIKESLIQSLDCFLDNNIISATIHFEKMVLMLQNYFGSLAWDQSNENLKHWLSELPDIKLEVISDYLSILCMKLIVDFQNQTLPKAIPHFLLEFLKKLAEVPRYQKPLSWFPLTFDSVHLLGFFDFYVALMLCPSEFHYAPSFKVKEALQNIIFNIFSEDYSLIEKSFYKLQDYARHYRNELKAIFSHENFYFLDWTKEIEQLPQRAIQPYLRKMAHLLDDNLELSNKEKIVRLLKMLEEKIEERKHLLPWINPTYDLLEESRIKEGIRKDDIEHDLRVAWIKRRNSIAKSNTFLTADTFFSKSYSEGSDLSRSAENPANLIKEEDTAIVEPDDLPPLLSDTEIAILNSTSDSASIELDRRHEAEELNEKEKARDNSNMTVSI